LVVFVQLRIAPQQDGTGPPPGGDSCHKEYNLLPSSTVPRDVAPACPLHRIKPERRASVAVHVTFLRQRCSFCEQPRLETTPHASVGLGVMQRLCSPAM
jgi:hypothetical protein